MSLCRVFNVSLTPILALLASVLFFTSPSKAQDHRDTCEVGGGANDIYTVSTAYDSDTDTITVTTVLCGSTNNKTDYRVYFDHTPPLFSVPGTEDRNGDGIIDASDLCANTWDHRMRRYRGKNKGPGIKSGASDIVVAMTYTSDDTLIYNLPVTELNSALTNDDTVYIWTDAKFKGTRDRAPYTEGGDGCPVPEYENEVLALTLSGRNQPPINNPPETTRDLITTNKNTPSLPFDVLANDNDPDGDPLTLENYQDTGSRGGAISQNGDGNLVYTPPPDFIGLDFFGYIASDGELSATGAVTVTVLDPGNRHPEAVDDVAVTQQNTPVSIDVLANDSDPDGDPLSVVVVGSGANGSAVIAGAGTGITYTPNSGFYGLDFFTYTIDDGRGGRASATVRVTVNPDGGDPGVTDTVQLARSSVSVTEGGDIVIAITRLQVGSLAGGAISVDFTVSDGSAETGNDYQGASGTFNWAAGDFSDRDVTLSTIADDLIEGNEEFFFKLFNSTGGAALGDPSEATITIEDSDLPGGVCCVIPDPPVFPFP
jgi:hypothetical protein